MDLDLQMQRITVEIKDLKPIEVHCVTDALQDAWIEFGDAETTPYCGKE